MINSLLHTNDSLHVVKYVLLLGPAEATVYRLW